jgi:HEPN domain-containing protein
MPRRESLYPDDWFRIGNQDLDRARNLLKLEDIIGAGFNIQQATEKYIKGYLLSKGWQLRRIHDLEILVNELILYDQSFDEFRADCQKITEYYLEERYPFVVSSELTEDEIRKSLMVAENIITKIKCLINRDIEET